MASALALVKCVCAAQSSSVTGRTGRDATEESLEVQMKVADGWDAWYACDSVSSVLLGDRD